jgi:hypothetical protein
MVALSTCSSIGLGAIELDELLLEPANKPRTLGLLTAMKLRETLTELAPKSSELALNQAREKSGTPISWAPAVQCWHGESGWAHHRSKFENHRPYAFNMKKI